MLNQHSMTYRYLLYFVCFVYGVPQGVGCPVRCYMGQQTNFMGGGPNFHAFNESRQPCTIFIVSVTHLKMQLCRFNAVAVYTTRRM